jgi:uncharacterized protein (TIRG00374 family)
MKIKHFILNKIIISTAITFLLVYFLLNKIDHKSIFYLFGDINYFYVLVSFLFYFILTFIRALRIKLLINRNSNFKNLFATVLVNNLILNLLPFRSGELSLPLLLKKYSGIRKREGFLLLFYLRTIDMIILLSFLIITILLFSGSVIQLKNISYAFVFVLLLLAFLALFKGDKLLLILSGFSKKRNYCRFLKKVFNFTSELLPVYEFYKNKIKETVILSVLIFVVLIFVLGFVLKAYPIDLGYVDIIIVSLIIIIITSLPINGIAGIGTVEFGIASFLISLGIDKNLSVAAAFNYHFIYLMFIVFFGSLSYLYLNYKRGIDMEK